MADIPLTRYPACDACPLHESAVTRGIPTVRIPSPDTSTALLFIGQNPGALEDQSGLPFQGRSGKLLREAYLQSHAFHTRATIYLGNAARCGPTTPIPNPCVRKCVSLYLADDLSHITSNHERVAIICLGASATYGVTYKLLGRGRPLRWGFQNNAHALPSTPYTLFFTYHPAALIRDNNLTIPTEDHLSLLNNYLDGTLPTASSPTLIPPTPPPE